jgi:hypothetical protein
VIGLTIRAGGTFRIGKITGDHVKPLRLGCHARTGDIKYVE